MLSQIQHDLINFDYTRETLLTENTSAQSGFDAIRNTSDQKILGVFKTDQFICSHPQAVEKVEGAFAEMNMNPDVTQFELMKDGAQLYVHYRLPNHFDIDLGTDIPGVPGSDILCPEVILRNGYDGKTTFGLEYGLHRLVCSNGLRTMIMGNRATAKMYLGDVDIAVIVAGMKEFCEVLLLNLKNRITVMVANMAPTMREETREWVMDHLSNKLLGVYDQQIAYMEDEIGADQISEWCCYNILTFMTSHMMNSYARQRSVGNMLSKHFSLTVTPGIVGQEDAPVTSPLSAEHGVDQGAYLVS